MNYCIIELKSQTASFRHPDFQNFHKTLFLPPPTTIIGLAGAALGLSPKGAQEYFDESNFQIGVHAKSLGKARDLWKYNDFKNGSIIIKEILYVNRFIIVFGNSDLEKIEDLKSAFLDPKYALSLGNSDSMVKLIDIRIESESILTDLVEDCLLEGDIIAEVFDNADTNSEFSIYTTSDPIAIDLPTRFEYKSDYGMRNVVSRKTLSFITNQMKLNVEKTGVMYKDTFIPVFQIN